MGISQCPLKVGGIINFAQISRYMRFSLLYFLFISIVVLISCGKKTINTSDDLNYIFLGHTYDYLGTPFVDPRLEQVDFNEFDEIWLGGDITGETSVGEERLNYLEKMFNISDENTHWAIGNHDFQNGDYNDLINRTGRNVYYAHTQNGITRLIINTNLGYLPFKDNCEWKQKQFDYLMGVLDTISEVSHLVILTHTTVWSDVEEYMKGKKTGNAPSAWTPFTCEKRSQFKYALYPKLKEIQNSGIQVIVISGDGGQLVKKYKYKADNGIEFYVSGFCNQKKSIKEHFGWSTEPDSILVFTHNIERKEIKSQFINFEEYIENPNDFN
jgi:hypothetical protein